MWDVSLRPVYHLPIINTCVNVQHLFILSSKVYRVHLVCQTQQYRYPRHQTTFLEVPHAPGIFVLLVHCPDAWHLTVWIIIRTRWSLFYLFNPKSALLWWYIVNTHGLSCTFTLFFAHCSSWHFRHFLLEWFYTFQKYILHWGSLDHKCAFCCYPKASLFHTLS